MHVYLHACVYMCVSVCMYVYVCVYGENKDISSKLREITMRSQEKKLP